LLRSISIATHWRVDIIASSKRPKKLLEIMNDVMKTKINGPISYVLSATFIVIRKNAAVDKRLIIVTPIKTRNPPII